MRDAIALIVERAPINYKFVGVLNRSGQGFITGYFYGNSANPTGNGLLIHYGSFYYFYRLGGTLSIARVSSTTV